MKTLTVRIPDDLHKESNEVLEQIGMDVPTAFRLFLTQVAATRSIPFEMSKPASTFQCLRTLVRLRTTLRCDWEALFGGCEKV